MTGDYIVAAEGVHEVPGDSLRTGSREARQVVVGTSHAVLPDGDETACGLPRSGLVPLPDRAFQPGALRDPCPACRRIVHDA